MESWTTIANRLKERREEIIREIRSFPSPIPACDVHYNSLLEERRSITDELQRIDELAREGKISAQDYLSRSSLIEEIL